MRKAELRQHLRDARTAIDELEALVDVRGTCTPRYIAAHDQLRTWAEAVSAGAGGPSGSGTTDPTLAAVLARLEGRDPAAEIRKTRDELESGIEKAAEQLASAARLARGITITRYHRPNNDLGCANCKLEGVWAQPWTRHAPAGSELSNKPRCRFCSDFAERYGVDAAREIIRWHLEHLGQRVPYTFIRQHHPEEFSRHHGAVRAS